MKKTIITDNFIYGPLSEIMHLYNFLQNFTQGTPYQEIRNSYLGIMYDKKEPDRCFNGFTTVVCEYISNKEIAGYCFGFKTNTPYTPDPSLFRELIALEAPNCKLCFDTCNAYEATRYNPDNVFFTDYKYVVILNNNGILEINNARYFESINEFEEYLDLILSTSEVGVSLEDKIRITEEQGVYHVLHYENWLPEAREKLPQVICLSKDSKNPLLSMAIPYINELVFDAAKQVNREILFVSYTNEIRIYDRDKRPGRQLEVKFNCADLRNIEEYYGYFANLLDMEKRTRSGKDHSSSIKKELNDYISDLKIGYIRSMALRAADAPELLYADKKTISYRVFEDEKNYYKVSANMSAIDRVQDQEVLFISSKTISDQGEDLSSITISIKNSDSQQPLITSIASGRYSHLECLSRLIKGIEKHNKVIWNISQSVGTEREIEVLNETSERY